MARKIRKIKKKAIKNKSGETVPDDRKFETVFRDILTNATFDRTQLIKSMLDPRRNINSECGYPDPITTADYKFMYDREGVAARTVSIFPEESWAEDPLIEENDKPEKTEFELAWDELERERNLFSYMSRIDELSGIGRYGLLLLGINDTKELSEPVDGVEGFKIKEKKEIKGGKRKTTKEKTTKPELLYVRAFDESSITIKDCEKEVTNPRFGMPILYSIKFESESTLAEKVVHWTRVIHVADNRKNSEVYGVPRMQTLFNRLQDLRKILGGSAEMFWKGGFPGFIFEMDPQSTFTPEQEVALRETIADWQNGLQRVIRTQGITAKGLAVQLADPKAHVEVQLEYIAIAMGIPKRIFMGAEQAKLASTKDTEAWNKRIKKRQNKYLTPYIVRETINRLIAIGVLPEPVEGYDVEWPDMGAPSEKDKAEVLKLVMEALAKYMDGNVDMLIPPEVLFKKYMAMDADEIKEVIKQLEDNQDDIDEDELNKPDEAELAAIEKQKKLDEKERKKDEA